LARLDLIALLHGLLPWTFAGRQDQKPPESLSRPGGRASVDDTRDKLLAFIWPGRRPTRFSRWGPARYDTAAGARDAARKRRISNSCQTSRIGTPSAKSRARRTSDTASDSSGATPKIAPSPA